MSTIPTATKAALHLEGAAGAFPSSPLSRAPFALFAIVMGLGGSGIAWRRSHQVLGTPAWIGEAFFGMAGLVFALVLLVQILRMIRFAPAVLREFRHPVTVNFMPASTVALALLAAGAAPYWCVGAAGMWIIAASLHLLLAFVILRRWFSGSLEAAEASPAWFIPIIGTVVMPVVGAPLGFVEPSWFLFSVGFVFWLILAPVMTYRLFFAGALPERALPSLFILLAPPAVSALAILALNGGAANALSHVLFCFAGFICLLVASMLGRIAHTHFAIGWWALTFPSAAFASLSLAYASILPGHLTLTVAIASLAFCTVVVFGVGLLTLRAILRSELLPEA